MTIFIDDFKAKFGRMKMCHMMTDSETFDELHEIAAKIGIKRKWFQGDHYDICLSKRELAAEFGARLVSWRELGAMLRKGILLRKKEKKS